MSVRQVEDTSQDRTARCSLSGGFAQAGMWLGVLVVLFALGGCVSDAFEDESSVVIYRRVLAAGGSQARVDDEGQDSSRPLGLLRPAESPEEALPELEIVIDPNTSERTVRLTLEQAVVRTLARSPEIRIVAFDPDIAKEEITKAAAKFDPLLFSELNYDDQDSPENSIFEPGEAETRLLESGVRQRLTTGAQWSAGYMLTRRWDDLVGRTFPTRYEPMLTFQLKQPLLRDAGAEVNLAGVNVARLNHRVALLGFRERAEEVSTQVVQAYWRLVQAHRDLEIQQELLERTLATLNKVEGRREIDATGAQVRQAEAYAKSRQAFLLQLEKRVEDARDLLIRLMADAQLDITSDTEVVPVTSFATTDDGLENMVTKQQALALAMQHNPVVRQARTGVEIADINVRVAKNQRMPRLDLVASARTQGLDRDRGEAHDQLTTAGYGSYAVGLTFEFALGDRERYAELRKRRLERRKAVAVLHNVADQVGVQVNERFRKVQTNLAEVAVQRQAVLAARQHLQALEDSEMVRQRLTPEFLLVKLQAQETLAQAQRALVSALVTFKIGIAELAQATGTVLDLHEIDVSLSAALLSENTPRARLRGPEL